MKLVYLRGATRDIESIRRYIGQDDPAAATRVVARIEQVIDRLVHYPFIGRPGPKRIRLISVPGLPYVVIYRVQGDEIKIAAVFHTSRNRRF
jgi:toxin ParE1/3/4